MTPDPAPTVTQLLAFYLEAGVDCALTDEAVNRLSDADVPAAPDAVQTAPGRTITAAASVAHATPAPSPDVAILSARETARTAPLLEALRNMLEEFDGCALK